MELRYANPEDVALELGISVDDPADEARVAQIERIERALSLAFDERVNRSFGDTPVASQRTIGASCISPVAILTTPAQSVTGVVVGGRYVSGGWVDEEIVTSYLPRYDRKGLVYALERINAYWPESIRVTAIWADDAFGVDVPEDVSYALTWLTIRQFRKMTSSPSETIGPDGAVITTPDGWHDATVRMVIDKYRVSEVII